VLSGRERVVEAPQVVADSRRVDVGFFGAVGADGGEQVEGGLPVVAGLLGIAEGAVGVGESVVCAGLIGRLAEVQRQLQGGLLVADGVPVVVGSPLDPAKAVVSLELSVAVTHLIGDA